MKKTPIALVQFDAVPEELRRNVARMVQLARSAASRGARWIVLHEGTVCDYTPRLPELAEPVPAGPASQAMLTCAAELGCFISFGLSEAESGRCYITQVFVGPHGLVYRYRKTWIWHQGGDEGYRNEWARSWRRRTDRGRRKSSISIWCSEGPRNFRWSGHAIACPTRQRTAASTPSARPRPSTGSARSRRARARSPRSRARSPARIACRRS
jgi:hypothetical protein